MRRTAVPLLALALLGVSTPASAQSASPVPAPTPPYDCGARIEVTSPVDAWGLDGRGGAEVTVHGSHRHPGSSVRLQGYTRPAGTPPQERVLATATTDENSVARITLPIQGSTRLYAVAEHCVFASQAQVVVVRARLGGLHAHRNGPRDYSFSAFYAGPAGKIGNLYRVLPDGREVLTSQTRLAGEWISIRRVFTGSGRFGFVLRAGDDINSLGASTNIRDTVIH
jgi:hypothetical protein